MLNRIRHYFSAEQRAWRRFEERYASQLWDALDNIDPLSRAMLRPLIVSSCLITKQLVCKGVGFDRLLEKSVLEISPKQLSTMQDYLTWVLLAMFSRSLRTSVPEVGLTGLVEDCSTIIRLTSRDESAAEMILALPSLDIAQVSKRSFSDLLSIVGQERPGLLKEVEWEIDLGAAYIQAHKAIETEIQALSKR